MLIKVFIILTILLQSLFYNGGLVTIDCNNEISLNFIIDGRYLKTVSNTQGHGDIISYTIVGSNSYIVYVRAHNTKLDFEEWQGKIKAKTTNFVSKSGYRDSLYWRTDEFYLENYKGRFCLLHGSGKDSLEINKIMDSAYFKRKD